MKFFRPRPVLLIIGLCLSLLSSCGKGGVFGDDDKSGRSSLVKGNNEQKSGDSTNLSQEKNLRAKVVDVTMLNDVYKDDQTYIQNKERRIISDLDVTKARCTLRKKDMTVGSWPGERDNDAIMIVDKSTETTDATGIRHIFITFVYYPEMQLICSKPSAANFKMSEINETMGNALNFFIP